jgi:hypothetical protein
VSTPPPTKRGRPVGTAAIEGVAAKLARRCWPSPISSTPFRFIAGADALAQAEEKLAKRRQQIGAHRDLSSSLAFDDFGGVSAGQPTGRVVASPAPIDAVTPI